MEIFLFCVSLKLVLQHLFPPDWLIIRFEFKQIGGIMNSDQFWMAENKFWQIPKQTNPLKSWIYKSQSTKRGTMEQKQKIFQILISKSFRLYLYRQQLTNDSRYIKIYGVLFLKRYLLKLSYVIYSINNNSYSEDNFAQCFCQ